MPVLQLQKINHFFGGLHAVRSFSLDIGEGELRGLIGPNGAGKTTLFNLVSGFYRPSEGDILLKGKPIAGLRPHQVTALGLARTFQNIRMWNSMTVMENLCIPQHAHLGYGLLDTILGSRRFVENEKRIRSTALEMLEILELREFAAEYPKNLPYGLQRRVEIGRALVLKPRLLLLDEPAAGMNPSDIDKLIELIRWIRDQFKLTLWLIEHQMKVVMSVCEAITVLDFGQIIAEGRPDDIRNNPAVIRAYLGDEGISDARG